MYDRIKEFINPRKNPDLTQAQDLQREHLPTLWLLGKTGAGKSSLVSAVTGLSNVEIGNGFAPCTKTSTHYVYPDPNPLLRFLDTRGLGEADYDPAQDIQQAQTSSHGLVVLIRADDPEQSALLNALQQIKKHSNIKQILLLHTAVSSCNDEQRARQVSFNQQQVEKVWGSAVDAIEVDFALQADEDDPQADYAFYHHQQLIDALATMLPIIELVAQQPQHSDAEHNNFKKLEDEILWYSGSAATTDLFPAIGLVTVPAVQAKMLHSLANQYGVEWNRRTFSELIGCMGGSFALQYAVKLGARQLPKLIPGWGQTVAAATAATISFGTSYALGRAACYYFYKKSRNEAPDRTELQSLYKKALIRGKKASGYEKAD